MSVAEEAVNRKSGCGDTTEIPLQSSENGVANLSAISSSPSFAASGGRRLPSGRVS